MKRIYIALFLGLLFCPLCPGKDAVLLSKLDKFVTPIPDAGQRNDYVTQNLGPTGARGWIAGKHGLTTDSREILVKSIEPGSPADGVLQPYDIIVGIGDQPFGSDARFAFANAITQAESRKGNGKLTLLRWRDGATEKVAIKLPVLGDYSDTAPFNCEKSSSIVSNAAAFLVKHMPVEGFTGSVSGPLDALLLCAIEDVRYMDHVRRTAVSLKDNEYSDDGKTSWYWGYANLFLTEYYLATGDSCVLPKITELSRRIAAGQCNPGTWGHKTVDDFRPPAYGSMNQAGLVCFLSLALARQSGVKVDEEALIRSIMFYGRYAGIGSIPYGDHPPAGGSAANGKNGSAAIVFNLLGSNPISQWFARLSCSASTTDFEGGHTGNFFNQTWTPLGASLAGLVNYHNFMVRHSSYRDLARRCDGSFITQPVPDIREGDLGTRNYVGKGPLWATGGFALSYLAGSERLGILGRKESVFSAAAPQELAPALALFRQKRFADCAKNAEPMCKSDNTRVKQLATKLRSIALRNQASIELTLKDMRTNCDAGDYYSLKYQLNAIEPVVDKADLRLAGFYKAVGDPANSNALARSISNRNKATGLSWRGIRGFNYFSSGPVTDNRKVALVEQKNSSGKTVKPKGNQDAEDAGAGSDEAAAKLAADDGTDAAGSEGKGPAVVLSNDFTIDDPANIKNLILDWGPLQGDLQVLLNETTIVNSKVSSNYPFTLLLKPSTLQLLKKGKNSLVFKVSSVSKQPDVTYNLTAETR